MRLTFANYGTSRHSIVQLYIIFNREKVHMYCRQLTNKTTYSKTDELQSEKIY